VCVKKRGIGRNIHVPKEHPSIARSILERERDGNSERVKSLEEFSLVTTNTFQNRDGMSSLVKILTPFVYKKKAHKIARGKSLKPFANHIMLAHR
jgi:hypothetical protein